MSKTDIAVIGTGPGGISAAITAKQRGKTVLLIGSAEMSPKMLKAEKIMNYPGLAAVSGRELAAAFAAHLENMQIDITPDRIISVYDMGGSFALQGASGEMYEAGAVIIASGIVHSKLYPGEAEFLGRGVSYCATCDAPLYKGQSVCVIADSPKQEAEARYLAEVASDVIYFPLYKEKPVLENSNITVADGYPKEIKSDGGSRIVVTDKGEYKTECVFILRESVAIAQLLPGLAEENGHIAVDRQMRTSVKGCFACGDITGRPYQYVKAAGEGNIAALSAVEYLEGR